MTRGLLRILGIDPGLNRTGWGVIETDGVRLRWIEHGVIRVPAGELPQRLHVILEQLALVIRTTQPHCASVERVFVNVNPHATLLLGQARGAAICAAVHAGLAVREHTALQVKQAVVGYGKADKLQVQTMVQRLLALPIAPPSDAADALACAICDAHTHAAFANGGRATLPAAAARGASTGRQRRARAAWRVVAEKLS